MNRSPQANLYHHYLFYEVDKSFYQLGAKEQREAKAEMTAVIRDASQLTIDAYATLGFKAGTTFMLWCRSDDMAAVQNWLPRLLRTEMGAWLALRQIYFGAVQPSQYSGRTGKPDQVMQNFDNRLPYFVLYPFAKTHEWYMLDPESRRSLMGQHIKIGVQYPKIRQCLLYSYGLDDHEFVVAYEMPSLDEFQALVKEMRSTLVRQYTLRDTPAYTGIHKSLDELVAWL